MDDDNEFYGSDSETSEDGSSQHSQDVNDGSSSSDSNESSTLASTIKQSNALSMISERLSRRSNYSNTVDLRAAGMTVFVCEKSGKLIVSDHQTSFSEHLEPMNAKLDYFSDELQFFSRSQLFQCCLEDTYPVCLINDETLHIIRKVLSWIIVHPFSSDESKDEIRVRIANLTRSESTADRLIENGPESFMCGDSDSFKLSNTMALYDSLSPYRKECVMSQTHFASFNALEDYTRTLELVRKTEETASEFVNEALKIASYKSPAELVLYIPKADRDEFVRVHARENDSYFVFVRNLGSMLRGGQMKSGQVAAMLLRSFGSNATLKKLSHSEMILFGEVCAMSYIQGVLAKTKDSSKSYLDAVKIMTHKLSQESRGFFEMKENEKILLNRLMDSIRDSGMDRETVTDCRSLLDSILSSTLTQEKKARLQRLKGHLYEKMMEHHWGVEVKNESKKENLENILKDVFPKGGKIVEKMKTVNEVAIGLKNKPDTFSFIRVTKENVDGLNDSQCRVLDEMEFAVSKRFTGERPPELTRLVMQDAESLSSGGSSGSDSTSCENMKDLKGLAEVRVGDDVLLLYEFGWVRNREEKFRFEVDRWAQTLGSLWLLQKNSKAKVVLFIDVKTNNDEFFDGDYHGIKMNLSLLFGEYTRMLSLQDEIREDARHMGGLGRVKNTKSIYNRFEDLSEVRVEMKKSVIKELETEQTIDEFTLEELKRQFKDEELKENVELFETESDVSCGVEFLSRVVGPMMKLSESDSIEPEDVKKFDEAFYKEFEKNNSNVKNNLRGIVDCVLLSDRDFKTTNRAKTKKQTALDRAMRLSLPFKTSAEKSISKTYESVCHAFARKLGVEMISRKDGSVVKVGSCNKGPHEKVYSRLVKNEGDEKIKDTIYELLEDCPSGFLSLIDVSVTMMLKQVKTQGAPDDNNCYRRKEDVCKVSDVANGILEDQVSVFLRDRDNRLKPKCINDNGTLDLPKPSGLIPEPPFVCKVLRKMEKVMSSRSACKENTLDLVLDPAIVEALAKAGTTHHELRILRFAGKIISSVKWFENAVILSKVSQSFLTMNKAKRGGLLRDKRVAGTDYRLYMKSQRNNDEGMDTMLIDDRGVEDLRLKQNHKSAGLFSALPQTALNLFVLLCQEQLMKVLSTDGKTEDESLEAILSELEDAVKVVMAKVRRDYEDLSNRHCEVYIETEAKDEQVSPERKICNRLVGIMLNLTFRTSCTSDNNTAASLTRYAIMLSASEIADPKGLGKKLAVKCVSVLDYLEICLIRKMFHNRFRQEKHRRTMPECYSLGYETPENLNEAVTCMYFHHFYNRELGERSKHVNSALSSYLSGEMRTRREYLENPRRISGDFDLTALFKEYRLLSLKGVGAKGMKLRDNDQRKREVVRRGEECVKDILSQNDDKTALYCEFTTRLSAALYRLKVGEHVMTKIATSAVIAEPLTRICEGNSVIETFNYRGGLKDAVKAVVTDLNLKVANKKSTASAVKAKAVGAEPMTLETLSDLNPDLLKIIKTIDSELNSMSESTLKDFIDKTMSLRPHTILKDDRQGLFKFMKQTMRKVKIDLRNNPSRKASKDSVSKITELEISEFEVENVAKDLIPKHFDEVILDKNVISNLEGRAKELLGKFKRFNGLAKIRIVNTALLEEISREENSLLDDAHAVLPYVCLKILTRYSGTALMRHEWLKPKRAKSIKTGEIRPSPMASVNFLSDEMKSLEEYAIRTMISSNTLQQSCVVNCSTEGVGVDFLRSAIDGALSASSLDLLILDLGIVIVGLMTKSPSSMKSYLSGSSLASLSSKRSTSLELMASTIALNSEVGILSTAQKLLKAPGYDYVFGCAPKAQFMGSRELCILHHNAKIVMSCLERISAHVLQSIDTDLLETPERKDVILESTKQCMKLQSAETNHFMCTSGDRSKWGPQNNYNHFRIFSREFFKGTQVTDLMECVLLTGMIKKIEMPVASIKSVVNVLLNTSKVKSEGIESISRTFEKLSDKVKTCLPVNCNYYKPLEEADLLDELDLLVENNKISRDITIGTVRGFVFNDSNEIHFDWADHLDMEPELLWLCFRMCGHREEFLMLLHRLCQGKTYFPLISHMNQGIPHRTSSVVHNASMNLSQAVFAEICKRTGLETVLENSAIEFVTSSDDYYYYMTCPKRACDVKRFEKMYLDLDKCQVAIARLLNITNSPKSMTGKTIGEVYSVFVGENEPVYPLIKLMAQFCILTDQTSILSMNLEETTKQMQLVDNSCTSASLVTYQACKLSLIKAILNPSEQMFKSIIRCSGNINPFINAPYPMILTSRADTIMLRETSKGYSKLLKDGEFKTVNDIKILSNQMRHNWSASNEEKMNQLTAILMDGCFLSPKETPLDKANNVTKESNSRTKIPETMSLPPSSKLKARREKLRESTRLTDESTVADKLTSLLARGGLTQNRDIEKARIRQAASSPKLEIRLSRAYEKSGLNLISRFMKIHCLNIGVPTVVKKVLKSFYDLKRPGDENSSRDNTSTMIERKEYSKYRLEDVLTTCRMAAAIVINFDIICEGRESPESLVVNSRTIKWLRAKLEHERDTKLEEISRLPDEAKALDQSVRPKQKLSKMRRKGLALRRLGYQDEGESSKAYEILESDLKRLEVSLVELDDVTDNFCEIEVSIVLEMLRSAKETIGEFLANGTGSDVDSYEMYFTGNTREVEPIRKTDRLIRSHPHSTRGLASQLENEWAHVACSIIYKDEFKDLDVQLENPSSLLKDQSIMVSLIGLPEKSGGEREYFQRAEVACSRDRLPTRISHLRGTKVPKVTHSRDLLENVGFNIIEGYEVRFDFSSESYGGRDNRIEQSILAFTTMLSGCSTTGRDRDTLDYCMNTYINVNKWPGAVSLRDIHRTQLYRRTGDMSGMVTLNNLIVIHTGGTDTADTRYTSQQMHIIRGKVHTLDSLSVTDGSNCLTLLIEKKTCFSSVKSHSMLTALLLRLIKETLGTDQLSSEKEEADVCEKLGGDPVFIGDAPCIYLKLRRGRITQVEREEDSDMSVVFDEKMVRGKKTDTVTKLHTKSIVASENGLKLVKESRFLNESPLATELMIAEIKAKLEENRDISDPQGSEKKDVKLSALKETVAKVNCKASVTVREIMDTLTWCRLAWPGQKARSNIQKLSRTKEKEIPMKGRANRSDVETISRMREECVTVQLAISELNSAIGAGKHGARDLSESVRIPLCVATDATLVALNTTVLKLGFVSSKGSTSAIAVANRARRILASSDSKRKELYPYVLRELKKWLCQVRDESESFLRFLLLVALSSMEDVDPDSVAAEYIVRELGHNLIRLEDTWEKDSGISRVAIKVPCTRVGGAQLIEGSVQVTEDDIKRGSMAVAFSKFVQVKNEDESGASTAPQVGLSLKKHKRTNESRFLDRVNTILDKQMTAASEEGEVNLHIHLIKILGGGVYTAGLVSSNRWLDVFKLSMTVVFDHVVSGPPLVIPECFSFGGTKLLPSCITAVKEAVVMSFELCMQIRAVVGTDLPFKVTKRDGNTVTVDSMAIIESVLACYTTSMIYNIAREDLRGSLSKEESVGFGKEVEKLYPMNNLVESGYLTNIACNTQILKKLFEPMDIKEGIKSSYERGKVSSDTRCSKGLNIMVDESALLEKNPADDALRGGMNRFKEKYSMNYQSVLKYGDPHRCVSESNTGDKMLDGLSAASYHSAMKILKSKRELDMSEGRRIVPMEVEDVDLVSLALFSTRTSDLKDRALGPAAQDFGREDADEDGGVFTGFF